MKPQDNNHQIDEDEIGIDIEEEMPEDDAEFYIEEMKRIDRYTRECITAYFFDKNFHCGGKIPKDKLYHRFAIDFSEQAEIQTAIDWYWKLTGNDHIEEEDVIEDDEDCDEEEEIKDENYFDWEYLNILLQDIASRGIPKHRAGGILILHLELVEAVPVNWKEIIESL